MKSKKWLTSLLSIALCFSILTPLSGCVVIGGESSSSSNILSDSSSSGEGEGDVPYQPIKLESNGFDISDYTIIISATANQTEEYAAQVLQENIKKATQATLDIKTDNTKEKKNEIIIGETKRGEDDDVDFASLGEEGYTLKTVGYDLVIAANNKRGVIYGVYAYLEALGFRYYTAECENIPEESDVFVPEELDVTFVPELNYREISFNHIMYDANAPFAVSKGINGTFQRASLATSSQYGGGNGYMQTYNTAANRRDGLVHTIGFWAYESLITYNDGQFADMFMIDENGERSAKQICFTSQTAVDFIAGKVNFSIEQNRANGTATKIISVSSNDNAEYCRCENCAAAEAQYGSFGMVVNFVNQVADIVGRAYPDIMLEALRYGHYTTWEKDSVFARDNVSIRYVGQFGMEDSNQGAAGTGSHLNGGNGDPTIFNKQLEELALMGEISKSVNVYLRVKQPTDLFVLEGDFYAYWHIINAISKHNVTGIYCEGEYWSATAEFGEFRTYLLCKLMMNPSMSFEEYKWHMSNFLTAYYGEAAPYLQGYIDYLCDNAIGYTNNYWNGQYGTNTLGSKEDGAPFGLTKALLNTLNAFFDNAEKEVVGEYYIRVRNARMHLRYTELNALYYLDINSYQEKAEKLYGDMKQADLRMYEKVKLKEASAIVFSSDKANRITAPSNEWWRSV